MRTAPAQDGKLGLGGFHLDEMELALPLQSLREVQPCAQLSPLPCPNPAVIGGIDLRGVVVPVLDIRVTLGRAASPLPSACVIIMVHEGHVLGLLSNGVSGVFEVSAADVKPIASTEGAVALCQGAVVRKDTGAMVGLISPDALYASPLVPRTLDPEPERNAIGASGADTIFDEQGFLPVMLLRCGKVALSIDAMTVSATLVAPCVLPSALALGHCRGVIEHAGMLIPAIDLRALLGLGDAPPAECSQAFVVNTEHGSVAFLISQVMDVVRCPREAFLKVPTFALPHPRLLSATLPMDSLPQDVIMRSRIPAAQFLLIEGEALRQEEVVRNLASASRRREPLALTRQTGSAKGNEGASDSQGGQAVLTFMLGGETATPLDQLHEILPYSRDVSIFDARDSLLGVLVNRGRSIPVMCLSGLTGLPSPEESPAVSILVVAAGDALIGFAVPMLKSIETTNWEPTFRQLGDGSDSDPITAARSRGLVRVGKGNEERMLPLIDLVAIAQALQGQHIDCPCT